MTTTDPLRRRSCCQALAVEPHTLDCDVLLQQQQVNLAGADGRPIPAAPAPFVSTRPAPLWRAILTLERVDVAAPEAVRVELVGEQDDLPELVDELRAAGVAVVRQRVDRTTQAEAIRALAYPQTAQASQ